MLHGRVGCVAQGVLQRKGAGVTRKRLWCYTEGTGGVTQRVLQGRSGGVTRGMVLHEKDGSMFGP